MNSLHVALGDPASRARIFEHVSYLCLQPIIVCVLSGLILCAAATLNCLEVFRCKHVHIIGLFSVDKQARAYAAREFNDQRMIPALTRLEEHVAASTLLDISRRRVMVAASVPRRKATGGVSGPVSAAATCTATAADSFPPPPLSGQKRPRSPQPCRAPKPQDGGDGGGGVNSRHPLSSPASGHIPPLRRRSTLAAGVSFPEPCNKAGPIAGTAASASHVQQSCTADAKAAGSETPAVVAPRAPPGFSSSSSLCATPGVDWAMWARARSAAVTAVCCWVEARKNQTGCHSRLGFGSGGGGGDSLNASIKAAMGADLATASVVKGSNDHRMPLKLRQLVTSANASTEAAEEGRQETLPARGGNQGGTRAAAVAAAPAPHWPPADAAARPSAAVTKAPFVAAAVTGIAAGASREHHPGPSAALVLEPQPVLEGGQEGGEEEEERRRRHQEPGSVIAPSGQAPASRGPGASKAAKALARHQQVLSSSHPDIDPRVRLDAVIKSKMVVSSRMVHRLRGQVLAEVRAGIALPQRARSSPGRPESSPKRLANQIAEKALEKSTMCNLWAVVVSEAVKVAEDAATAAAAETTQQWK
ncbi:hypothetical protein VaNZ11_013183, partial [Volvox africanus]